MSNLGFRVKVFWDLLLRVLKIKVSLVQDQGSNFRLRFCHDEPRTAENSSWEKAASRTLPMKSTEIEQLSRNLYLTSHGRWKKEFKAKNVTP